jgi:outer membrane protein
MKRMQLYLLCLLVLSLQIVPYRAFAFGLEVGVGYWMQSPSGHFAFNSNGLTGTDLDLKSDLQYNTQYQPYARIKAELPLFLPNIYLMATPMSFDGTGQKNIAINFGGQTFNTNTPFESKLNLNHYDLAFYYSLPFLKNATLDVLNVEFGINGRVIDFQARVNQPTTDVSASKTLTIPVPMVYFGIQVKPVKDISIEAEARGIAYGSNSYFDIIGRAKLIIYGPAFISAGYRYEAVRIDQSGVKADVNFNGPLVEFGLGF